MAKLKTSYLCECVVEISTIRFITWFDNYADLLGVRGIDWDYHVFGVTGIKSPNQMYQISMKFSSEQQMTLVRLLL